VARVDGLGVAPDVLVLEPLHIHYLQRACGVYVGGGLSSEHDTYKTVKAKFWPWLSGRSPSNLRSCSPFARRRGVLEPLLS